MKASAIKQSRLHSIPLEEQPVASLHNDELIDLFPQPRYFQVHFQHIHDNTDALHKEIHQLRLQNAEIEAKLDMLLSLFNGQSKRRF